MAIDPTSLNLAQLEAENGLPAGLLAAVMHQESRGNPQAVSPAGAQGLFQFMPATAKQYGIDPFDPQQAAQGAARMYGDLSKQYGGDIPKMLAAYNWGSGNLAKYGLENAPKETRDYIAAISPKVGQESTFTEIVPTSQETELFNVEMPDGTIIEGIPSGTPKADIEAVWKKASANSPAFPAVGTNQDGFLTRVRADVEKRGAQGREALNADQTWAEKGLQVLGKSGAGTIGDIIGEIGVSGLRAMPDSIEQPIRQGGAYIGEKISPVIAPVLQKYGQWAKEHPRFARNVESGVNLLSLYPGSKAADLTTDAAGSVAQKTGKVIYESGNKSSQAAKSKFVKDLILPKETPSVKADFATRSVETGGIRGGREVILDPAEQRMVAAVSQLPVSKNKTLQGNYNVIKDANYAEADQLKSILQQNDVVIPEDLIVDRLTKVKDSLAKNTFIAGDGEKAANSVVMNALETIINNPKTASGLLQARKDLDRLIAAQRGSKGFNPNLEGPISIAIRDVRQAINDMVEEAVPEAHVKESLAKQSALYRAMDNIAPKAGAEGKTRASRLAKKVSNIATTKQGLASLAAAGGIGYVAPGLLASAGPIGAGALATYGAYKGITSPAVRKGVGMTLNKIGKTLKGN